VYMRLIHPQKKFQAAPLFRWSDAQVSPYSVDV
jgi:hypothetical protein